MELRKDYILERWVILADARKDRPRDFLKQQEKKQGTCFFCPGHEAQTPPESLRIEKEGKWVVRVIPNKFPAAVSEGMKEVRTDNTYFTFSNAYGRHEVVIETPFHDHQFHNHSIEEIHTLLGVYNKRILDLSRDSAIKYVVVFKNHGPEAGTSLEHSHTQIISLNIIPPEVQEEVSASHRRGRCAYCDILNIEKSSYRRCFENNTFVAFTPYASRFNYEIWIFPKRHAMRMQDLAENEQMDLASVLKMVTAKLAELGCSYNFFIHYAPDGQDLHLHLEVIPRIASWGGLEYSSNIVINSVSPETAAAFYRGEIK